MPACQENEQSNGVPGLLCWRHGPCIDVHVRVDLDAGDGETNGLEQEAGARGYDALPHTRDDA